MLVVSRRVIDVDVDEASEPRLKRPAATPDAAWLPLGASRSDVNGTDRGVPKAS